MKSSNVGLSPKEALVIATSGTPEAVVAGLLLGFKKAPKPLANCRYLFRYFLKPCQKRAAAGQVFIVCSREERTANTLPTKEEVESSKIVFHLPGRYSCAPQLQKQLEVIRCAEHATV